MAPISKGNFLKIWMEGLWILITAVIVFGIMYPIWRDVPEYPFTVKNIVHIVIFVTLARYIFLLQHTWLAHAKWPKVALILASAYLVIWLTRSLNDFTLYAEEYGLQAFMADLAHKDQWPLVKYIRTEYLFFAVGSIITAVIFPFRLLISVWRNVNRKGKV